jgi:hypothetical protein
MPKLPGSESGSPSEALRNAIERTFDATVDSAAGTRDRAGELRRIERELGSINERLEQLESMIRREVQKRKG